MIKCKQFTIISFLLLLCNGGLARAETILPSAKYPVHIHYNTPTTAGYAQLVLEAVESAWGFYVDQLGLPPPPADAGSYGSDDLDVFIKFTMSGGATTQVAAAPDRPHGSYSIISMDPSIPEFAIPLVISHEFHHAIQMGICNDMGYNLAEAGAVYASGLHRTGEAMNLSYFLGFNAFQAAPERSVDWAAELGNYYPYGGALYLMFFDEVFNDGQGGFIRALLLKMQEMGKNAPKCPHYLTAINALLDFKTTFKQFCRWRYFVGPHDDGEHFKDLSLWEGPKAAHKLDSVQLAADLQAGDLPVIEEHPKTSPMGWGVSYLRLNLAGLSTSDRLRLTFAGASAAQWSIQTILLGGSQPTAEGEVEVAADGTASLDLEVSDRQTLVLAFVNLGDGLPEPSATNRAPQSFSYSLEVLDPPQIAAVEPSTLLADRETNIRIKGQGFPATAPSLSFSSAKITVKTSKQLSAREIQATVRVAGDAKAGPVDLTISWGQIQASKQAAVQIEQAEKKEEEEEKEPLPTPEDPQAETTTEESSGCMLVASTPALYNGSWLLVGCVLLSAWRTTRRRRNRYRS